MVDVPAEVAIDHHDISQIAEQTPVGRCEHDIDEPHWAGVVGIACSGEDRFEELPRLGCR